jgi:ubiquinone/menaquinone biosynthesis C-methylase UbiE
MTTPDASDVQRAWQGSAPYWEKHRALIEEMFAPLTVALIEAAQISAGQRVLDVAGGTGEPSLTIARIVGPAGSVMYTDLIAGMVESASAEARKRGLTNIEFQQAPAEALPFPDNSFDAAVSRLGAMFFPDPIAAAREMLRVIVPGGYLAFVVWAPQKVNPFFYTVADVVNRYVESQPEDPDAPGAFRFATPGKLTSVLEQAGATQTTERTLKFNIAAPIPLENFWTMRTELSDTLREKVDKLTPDQLTTVKREVETGAREFFATGTMNFPAQALIARGRKHSAMIR